MTTISTLKQVIRRTNEKAWLMRLHNVVTEARIAANLLTVTNVYVALKSKPLLLLVGPEDQNKSNFVRCLAHQMIGGNCFQCQILLGHPWWVSPGLNLAFFSRVHSRFTSEKIMCLLEEAALPGNERNLFFAGLLKISPAELQVFFTEVSYQLQHGGVIRFGDLHLDHPFPFPETMHWVGTMDVNRFLWWDPDLSASTTVVHWQEAVDRRIDCSPMYESFEPYENVALLNPVRTEEAARRKLSKVLGGVQRPLAPLFYLQDILERHQIPFPENARKDIVIYLANAWSYDRSGLFDQSVKLNLEIGLDYALAQYFLPRLFEPLIRNPNLVKVLEEYFRQHFRYSFEQLIWLCDPR